jgi:2-keto-4-pentenoate hydratase
MSVEALAQRLHEARLRGTTVEIPSDLWPDSETQVIEVLDAVLQLGGLTAGGWKAGPPPLGLDSEVGAAPLPAEWTHRSPATVTLPGQPLFAEAEFVLRLGRDLGADHGPYTAEQVKGAVDAVAPGIELVWRRVAEDVRDDTRILHLADANGHAGFILSDWVEDWSSLDLSKHPVDLSVNGKFEAHGDSGRTMDGHPLNVLAALASREARLGRTLKAGSWVTTGSCTGLTPIDKGDKVEAEYGALGKVTVTVE